MLVFCFSAVSLLVSKLIFMKNIPDLFGGIKSIIILL